MSTYKFEVGKTYAVTIEQANGTFKRVSQVKVIARTEMTVTFEGGRPSKLFASAWAGKSGELAYPKDDDRAKIYAWSVL